MPHNPAIITSPAKDYIATDSPVNEKPFCTHAIGKSLQSVTDIEADDSNKEVTRRQFVNNNENDKHAGGLVEPEFLYSVDEVPPLYMCFLLGLQNYLTMAGSTISFLYILMPVLCIDENDLVRSRLLCTNFFVSGLATLIQTTFGVRLPIVHGASLAFLVPTIAMLNTDYARCEDLPLANMTAREREVVWQVPMREVQGAIIMTGLLQALIGFTGVMGLLLTWITPLTIVPTTTLIGLSLFDVAANKASLNWGISIMTMAWMILFFQFLRNVLIPFPAYTRTSGWYLIHVNVFRRFPVLLALGLSWGVCGVLTVMGVLAEGNMARTDRRYDLIRDSPWFFIPYPGQWGMPTVSLAGVLAITTALLSTTIQNVGNYYNCAKVAGVTSPPTHAVNRGIGMAGLGCVLTGLWGSGTGTTALSSSIGVISITKVASRRVVQMAAFIMLAFGLLGKFGAVFATIPEPVMGGVLFVIFSIITAVGLSPLQYIDHNSPRNLFILGFSIFVGLAIPSWVSKHPGGISTGVQQVDQVLTVLLETPMFIGGLLGFFLDNTVPGTRKERGLLNWNVQLTTPLTIDEETAGVNMDKSYDLPFGMDTIKNTSWTQYIPFSPTFTGFKKYFAEEM